MKRIACLCAANQYNSYRMSKILKVSRPSDYSAWVGHTDRHPLVSVIDYGEVSPIRHSLNDYDVYGIFLCDDEEVIGLKYGCGDYDYKKGTLMCVAPGQIGGKEDNEEHNLKKILSNILSSTIA